MKTYPCAENPVPYFRGRPQEYVKTGEFRAPKAGEWYLSGAIPEAYLARNNMTAEYYILKPANR